MLRLLGGFESRVGRERIAVLDDFDGMRHVVERDDLEAPGASSSASSAPFLRLCVPMTSEGRDVAGQELSAGCGV